MCYNHCFHLIWFDFYIAYCCLQSGRINHCAGCTMGASFTPAVSPPPRTTAIFHHAVLTANVWCIGLDVTTTKGRQLFWGRKVHPRENLGSAYEKRASALRWYAPEWLIRPTRPSIPSESVNEYQLRLGRQRQVWFIPLADVCEVCR